MEESHIKTEGDDNKVTSQKREQHTDVHMGDSRKVQQFWL